MCQKLAMLLGYCLRPLVQCEKPVCDTRAMAQTEAEVKTKQAEYSRRQNWLKVRLLNDQQEKQLVQMQHALGEMRGLDGPASRTAVCRWALDLAAKQILMKPSAKREK